MGRIYIAADEVLHQPLQAGYFVAQAMPTALGTITALTVLAIFVPLTGRMGVDVPVELIISNLVAILAVLFVPTATPLFHRFDKVVQVRILLTLAAATALSITIFAGKEVFSVTAPRRMFFQHEYNVSLIDPVMPGPLGVH